MESAQDISFRKRHFSELSQISSITLSPAAQRVHKLSKMDSLENIHLELRKDNRAVRRNKTGTIIS